MEWRCLLQTSASVGQRISLGGRVQALEGAGLYLYREKAGL